MWEPTSEGDYVRSPNRRPEAGSHSRTSVRVSFHKAGRVFGIDVHREAACPHVESSVNHSTQLADHLWPQACTDQTRNLLRHRFHQSGSLSHGDREIHGLICDTEQSRESFA